MAEKRTIDINIKNNADEATKDFNTFNDALDQTAKSAKNVNSTFEEVYGELQPLTTRLGEAEDRLYELALAGDTTSKEYQELLTKVGEYRKVQIQTDLAVDGAATTLTQKLGSALNAATSGFAATQGAIALFGSENEALEESLLKVQSALAIQQGVQGLTEAYKELSIGTKLAGAAQAIFSTVVGTTSGALKVFRIALLSTGIGAIVVGLGLLIANFEKVSKFVGEAIDSFKNLGPVMKALLLPITALVEGFELAKKGLQALGVLESKEEKLSKQRAVEKNKRAEIEKQNLKTLQEIRDNQFNKRQSQYDVEIRALRLAGKETIEIEKQKIQASIEYQKQKAKELQLILKTTEGIQEIQFKGTGKLANVARAYQKGRQKQAEQLEQINLDIANSELDLKELIINYNKDKADSYKEVQDAQQQALDAEIDAEIQLLAELDKIRQENEARFRTDEENELNAVAEKYDVLESMAYGNAEALNEIEIARLNEENEIKAKFATEAYNAQKALDDKAAAEEKERRDKQLQDIEDFKKQEKALGEYRVQVAQQSLTAIADIANLFAKGNEKQQKRAFQVQKAVGIAQATINTAQAITKVFAETTDFTPTQSLRIANAVGIGLAGAAQIASIASQQFTGGGDVETPTDIGGGGEVQAPSFNVVGDAGINQLAQLQQQPTQAFVVSGEVTSAQALDRNRVTNATL